MFESSMFVYMKLDKFHQLFALESSLKHNLSKTMSIFNSKTVLLLCKQNNENYTLLLSL
jgi:hypothetical protein